MKKVIILFALVISLGAILCTPKKDKQQLLNNKSSYKEYCSDFIFNKRTKTLNIHLFDNQGLGNRIKKILSYIRYYNPSVVNIYWPNEGWVSANFFDLFSFDTPIKINEISINYEKDIKTYEKNCIFQNKLTATVKDYRLLTFDDDFIDVAPFSIDVKYNIIPKNIIDIYSKYFNKIKPSKSVMERLNELNLPEKLVTVQVRSAPDWEKTFGKYDYNSFFEVMDKYPSDTYFYLSAMSKEVANNFYSRYPNRIIELPNKNYNSMIDATADMFILGSTDNTICSLYSTFCEVGWWLNGAKSKVTVVGSDEHWKKKMGYFAN